ncbi:MAG TPA: hypothetical protein VLL48_09010 [Longimicrobiales bacterium]|nr:hypothetical protein [Longimicrobiales bacterium]
MSGINAGRWIGGGVAAGALIWVMEGAASVLYMDQMETAMTSHGLSMEMSAGIWVLSVLVSLIVGLVLIFVYAAARPRFGPGPMTAGIAALVLWFGGYLPSLIGYHMLGLFPSSLLLVWACAGLLELILASLLGGWIYREGEEDAPSPGGASREVAA